MIKTFKKEINKSLLKKLIFQQKRDPELKMEKPKEAEIVFREILMIKIRMMILKMN